MSDIYRKEGPEEVYCWLTPRDSQWFASFHHGVEISCTVEVNLPYALTTISNSKLSVLEENNHSPV
jgi:hypothetical protein